MGRLRRHKDEDDRLWTIVMDLIVELAVVVVDTFDVPMLLIRSAGGGVFVSKSEMMIVVVVVVRGGGCLWWRSCRMRPNFLFLVGCTV